MSSRPSQHAGERLPGQSPWTDAMYLFDTDVITNPLKPLPSHI